MEGIVYKTIDYKEEDKICYLLTNVGPLSVRVKKAKLYKSKNHAFCNLVSIFDFEVFKAPILGLKTFNVIDNFYNIKTNYYKMIIAINVLEVSSLEHNISSDRLYNFVKNLLININDNEDYLPKYFIFLVKMLKVFGILPDLSLINPSFSYISLTNDEYNLIKKAYYGDVNNTFYVELSLVIKIINYYESMGLGYFKRIKETFKEF